MQMGWTKHPVLFRKGEKKMIDMPCKKCKSGFQNRICRKFCSAYKRAFNRNVERQLDEYLFRRLARFTK
ncbi:MAG: hypothetical protein ACFWUM_11655 [Eubacteriales bacterium]|jgi:hypothetical protein